MLEGYDDNDDFGTDQIAGKQKRSSRLAAADAMSSQPKGTAAGDTISSGMIASGNPYAMAAGLGLKVLSGQRKEKYAEDQLRAKAKLESLQRQDSALSRLIGISHGLRRL